MQNIGTHPKNLSLTEIYISNTYNINTHSKFEFKLRHDFKLHFVSCQSEE